jgi:hypothetical protein
MVDDIHFQKIVPSVSSTKRVKRSGRQDKQKHNAPFKKFLNQNEDNEEETNEDQKKKKQIKTMNPTQEQSGKNVTTVPSAENRNTLQNNSQRKGIDVRA